MMWTSCMNRKIVSGCYLYRIYRCLVFSPKMLQIAPMVPYMIGRSVWVPRFSTCTSSVLPSLVFMIKWIGVSAVVIMKGIGLGLGLSMAIIDCPVLSINKQCNFYKTRFLLGVLIFGIFCWLSTQLRSHCLLSA